MESNIEMAEKHLALQKEYNLTLKDAIETELKYSELKKKYDNLNKEFAAKQCELLREIGECNSLTKERDAIKARCDKMEAALNSVMQFSKGNYLGVYLNVLFKECGEALSHKHEGINEKEGEDEAQPTFNLSTEEKKKHLAKKIEARIKEAGLQRQEFADLMGVQPSTITRWLSGEHNFETNTLFEIERQLNIKLFNL
jgi:DNA-binding transcriptional regulator YiaG